MEALLDEHLEFDLHVVGIADQQDGGRALALTAAVALPHPFTFALVLRFFFRQQGEKTWLRAL